ncbi:MAG: alpha/beta fold hydrolase [Caldilineaceae bacterium]|nr:alpha/beta fold hydrolase [Caldilineaceae bacterium]
MKRASRLRLLLILGVGVILLVASLIFAPISGNALVSHSSPAGSYDEAIDRLHALQAAEGEDLNPLCRTRALTHGQRTERVVVLLHGFSNCPEQFGEFGRQMFAEGYTVLAPRLPRHGKADRLTEDLARLTAEEIISLADVSVDIAQGLGDQVILVGFSLGGVLAGEMAHQRSDIDAAILIAPAFSLQAIPESLTPLAARLFARLPNFWRWWDAEQREAIDGPQHAYPRFSSRALAQLSRLSLDLQGRAKETAPQTQNLLVITNANDESMDNRGTYEVVEYWRQHGATVQTYEFPQDLGLAHDLIDSDQPYQQIDLVYPILLGLIAEFVPEQ